MVVSEIHDSVGFKAAMQQAKGKLVVCDFFATWCGPCKAVAPKFDELSTKFSKEAVFIKLDVDQVRDVAQEAGVKQLPSFGYYHDGKLLELQVGGDVRAMETKIKTLSEKYATYAFKGQGYSLSGSSSSSSAAPAAAAAAKPSASSAAGRKNPWADPNFALAKAAKGATTTTASSSSSSTVAPASKPATTTSATTAAGTAKPSTTGAPSASSDGSRVNPWATKEIPKTTPPVTAPSSSPAAPAAASATKTDAPVSTAAAAAPAASSESTAAPATAASSSSSSSAATPAPSTTGPAANDPALTKQLNPTYIAALKEMGFGQIRVEKALILTQNKGVDPALNWLMEHGEDPDIDEPLQVVGTQAKAPAGVDLDDMDEDERVIYENALKKKMSEKGVAFAGGDNVAPAKQSTLNMTTEEKMEWLAKRRAEVRARKEVEALEQMKEKEKSRKNTVKASQALEELREAQQRKAADDAIRAKKKEEADRKRARADILAKLEEDKQRRREQAKREQEMIAAQKAAAEAAKSAKK